MWIIPRPLFSVVSAIRRPMDTPTGHFFLKKIKLQKIVSVERRFCCLRVLTFAFTSTITCRTIARPLDMHYLANCDFPTRLHMVGGFVLVGVDS